MAGISNASFPRSVGNRRGNSNAVHIVNDCSINYKAFETGTITRNLTPSLNDNSWDKPFQSEETSENLQYSKEPSKTDYSNFQPSVGDQSIKPAGLTWARWAENGSPKASYQNSKRDTSQAPVELKKISKAIVSKTETSEETLLRRVRSTARLWHDPVNSPPKHYLKRTSSLRVPSSRDHTLENRLIAPYSQGLGGRYKEKKPGRFSPYGYPML